MEECIDHGLPGIGDGYAQVKREVEGDVRWIFAHRYEFYKAYGYFPVVVRHTCDNPRCININHLLPGDHKDNARDAVERGRVPRGEGSKLSKLDEEKVRLMRGMYERGLSTEQELAEYFKVHRLTVRSVLSRRTWKHVS